MTLDIRIDRASLGSDDKLGLLISERISWSGANAWRIDVIRSLPPGPRALLVLQDVWTEIFNGGTLQLLYSLGDRLADAVVAASVVGAPEYEELIADLIELLPDTEFPAEHHERSEFVDALLDEDPELGDRLDAFDDRYDAIEQDIGSPYEFALRYAHRHPDQFFLSEHEAAADLDAFVARLAAVAGPVERATAERLAAARISLPPLLARLYRDVGEGGWGPAGGFLTIEEVVGAWEQARRAYRGPRPEDLWPHTLLPIVAGPAGELYCIDAREPHLDLVRLPLQGPRGWYDGQPTLPHEGASLRGWLESWYRRARA